MTKVTITIDEKTFEVPWNQSYRLFKKSLISVFGHAYLCMKYEEFNGSVISVSADLLLDRANTYRTLRAARVIPPVFRKKAVIAKGSIE